jgi:hypothetical protein
MASNESVIKINPKVFFGRVSFVLMSVHTTRHLPLASEENEAKATCQRFVARERGALE